MSILSAIPSSVLTGAGAYIAGAFTPSVGRKIKSYFVKETTSAKTSVTTEVTKVETAVKTDAEAVAKKL